MERTDFAERLASLRETRVRLPEIVRNRHASRHRRPFAGHAGRILLVEADQPAAGDLAAGDDPGALADRGELLRRLDLALGRRGVDGVIGTPDIVDDLLLLEALESRVVIGSMNRGGLRGSVFALDDRFTAYDADAVLGSHLDGGKMELRIDPDDPATAGSLEACGRAVTGLSGGAVIALIEPSWCHRSGSVVVADLSVEALVRAVDVASALGSRSPFTWLALPLVPGLADVMAATTLPVLVRVTGPVESGLDDWAAALRIPGVRGLVLSSASLYESGGDLADSVDAVARVVHADTD